MQRQVAPHRLYVVLRSQSNSTAHPPAEPKPTLFVQVPFDFDSVLDDSEAESLTPSFDDVPFDAGSPVDGHDTDEPSPSFDDVQFGFCTTQDEDADHA